MRYGFHFDIGSIFLKYYFFADNMDLVAMQAAALKLHGSSYICSKLDKS